MALQFFKLYLLLRRARASCLVRILCPLSLVLLLPCGLAQSATAPQVPPVTLDSLHALSRHAAVIFVGRVVAVRMPDPGEGSAGSVEVQFAVDDAVRGVSGAGYTLRLWTGLWPSARQPFRIGSRYLMLLHAPGPSGLSSPVGGMDGAIPLRPPTHSSAAGQWQDLIDLRWIAARAPHPASAGSQTAPRASILAILRQWEATDAAR